MKYQEYYYKNLCEKYQKRIDILKSYLYEAGLKSALTSGNPESLRKEYLRQKTRREAKLNLAGRKNLRAQQLSRQNSPKSDAFALSAESDFESARNLGANIEEIGMQLGVEHPDIYQRVRGLGMQQKTSGSYQY